MSPIRLDSPASYSGDLRDRPYSLAFEHQLCCSGAFCMYIRAAALDSTRQEVFSDGCYPFHWCISIANSYRLRDELAAYRRGSSRPIRGRIQL